MISIDTIWKNVKRHPNLKPITGVPIDVLRIKASDEDIDQYYTDIKNYIDVVPTFIIVNIDEAGFRESVDKKSAVCVVPQYYQ